LLNKGAGTSGGNWAAEPAVRRSNRPFPSTTSTSKPQDHSTYSSSGSSRGKRTPCYSAPSSPKFTTLPLDGHGRPLRPREESRVVSPSSENFDKQQVPDLVFISSLNVAQHQLASAGNVAINLTRQLSVPLRPMIYLGVFLSISSFTFMALAGFLIAGYLVTAWDDVNSRGKQIQKNVYSATSWCGKLLGSDDEESSSEKAPTTARSGEDTASHSDTPVKPLLPSRLQSGFMFPFTVAYKLIPTSISESFGNGNAGKEKDSASSRPHSSPSSTTHALPPRPPLHSLLPSIFLTILLALGAGLVGFFVDRKASKNSTTSSSSTIPDASPSSSSSSRPYVTTSLPRSNSQQGSVRNRNSFLGQQARRRSYAGS